MESIASPWLWGMFLGFVVVMLAVDLGVFHRSAHAVGVREAAIWSVVWVALAAGFGGLVYQWFGTDRALEFAAGYLIEKALAVDNIFVFVVIFAAFAIPAQYQHRVLFWGVLGALGMRAVFIFAGGALLAAFHWTMYVFGFVLAVTGLKLLRQGDVAAQPGESAAVRWFRRVVPVTDRLHGERFWVREAGRLTATPLFVALFAIEVTDLIFAVDSIPAIFAVTRDPFIVFTSNIFAILGLRSMYFLLAGVIHRFAYLKTGLAVVLIFVGAKMLAADIYKVPIGASLAIIATVLTASIVVSLWRDDRASRLAAQVANLKGESL